MMRYAKLITFSLLSLSILLGWANTLDNAYVYDDVSVIEKSRHIRDLRNIPDLLSRDKYFARSGIAKYRRYGEGSYRPIVTLSYFLDCQLIGISPAGSHAINVVYHGLYVALLYHLLMLLCGRGSLAFLSALFFAVHPINSEAINAIAFREDILCGIFICLSLISYHHFFKSGRKDVRRLGFTLFYFLLACFSKENGAIGGLLIFAYNFFFYTPPASSGEKPFIAHLKRFRAVYISFGVATILYAVIRFKIFDYSETITTPAFTFQEIATRFTRFINAILYYSRLIAVPDHLRPAYDTHFLHSPVTLLVSIPFTALIITLIVKNKTAHPTISFMLTWFLIALLPVSGLIFLQHPIAERYLYFPCIGILFPIVYFIQRTLNEKWIRALYFFCIMTLLLFRSIAQNTVWNTEFSLWDYAVKYSQNNYNTCANYAVVLSEAGRIQEAILYYKKALAIDNRAQSHYNLGNAYNQLGLKSKAEEEFRTSIKLDPNYSEAHNNLAKLLAEKGKYHEAINCLEKAIGLNPYNPQAFNNLGGCLNNLKQYDKGIKALLRAIELNPDYINAYFNLASAYYMTKDYLNAEHALRWIISKEPDNKRALSFLQSLLDERKNAGIPKNNVQTLPETSIPPEQQSPNPTKKTVPVVEFDSSIVPRSLSPLEELLSSGDELMESGKYAEALKFYRKAVKADAQSAKAFFKISECYIKLESLELAHQMLTKTLSLDPDYPNAGDQLLAVEKQLRKDK
ncbi:tetratricopeptide repeat protein [bacterium]|nr:tetratricopeptide repeat protein [bacterium]